MKTKIQTAVLIACVLFTSGFAFAKASKKSYSGQLNLNTASVEEIDQLPSISPKKAEAIVEYRKEHPLKSVEDLDNIKGFSPKGIAKLKPYVKTEGSSNFAVEGGSKSKKGKKTASAEKSKKSKKG